MLVSAFINPHGPPGRIVDAVLSRAIVVLYDDRILAEYQEVLFRSGFRFHRRDVELILNFVELSGEQISSPALGIVLPDHTDEPFLEVAITGEAEALVTGNTKHFRPRSGRHDIYVCTPAEFIYHQLH